MVNKPKKKNENCYFYFNNKYMQDKDNDIPK